MFMRGFERFVGRHGYEMRLDRFAMFQKSIGRERAEHLDLAAGRALFEDFFEARRRGHRRRPRRAPKRWRALAREASVVVLTNAPDQAARRAAAG